MAIEDRKFSYHLIISDGGKELICILKSERHSRFTEEEKEKLTNKYGNYIVVLIHPLSVDCFSRLDVIEDIEDIL